MLLDYDKLFDALRKLVKWHNWINFLQTEEVNAWRTLPKMKEETGVEGDVSANLLDEIDSLLEGYEEDLHATHDALLDSLAAVMEIDGQTIRKRTLEIAPDDVDGETVKADPDNVGDGSLVFRQEEEENLKEDWIRIVCTSPGVFQATSANVSETLSTAYENMLTNGTFDSWTDDELDNWTLKEGEYGVNLQKSTDAHRGDACIDSITGSWRLVQEVSMAADKRYVVGIWLKKEEGATGHLYLELVDENLNKIADDYLDIDVSSLSTGWTLHFFTSKAPTNLATAAYLSIRLANQGGAHVYLDTCQMAEMILVNGIYFALLEGSKGFGIGDKFGGNVGDGVCIQAKRYTKHTATEDSNDYELVFSGNVAGDFPVGRYIQHPDEKTWHRITNVEAGPVTTVTVTPACTGSWENKEVCAVEEGFIQKFLVEQYGKTLPSSHTPTQEDPEW